MALAKVQTNSGNPGVVTLGHQAFSSNNAAGNLLIAFARFADQTQTITFTDSAGNTWPGGMVLSNLGSSTGLWMAFAPNCVAGANTVNFQASGVAASMRVGVAEISGADLVNPVDVSNSSGATSTNASTSVTPTYATEYLFSAQSSSISSVPTAGTGQWTIEENVGNFLSCADGFGANPAGLETVSINLATSASWLQIFVAIKAPVDTGSVLLVPRTEYRLHEYSVMA